MLPMEIHKAPVTGVMKQLFQVLCPCSRQILGSDVLESVSRVRVLLGFNVVSQVERPPCFGLVRQ